MTEMCIAIPYRYASIHIVSLMWLPVHEQLAVESMNLLLLFFGLSIMGERPWRSGNMLECCLERISYVIGIGLQSDYFSLLFYPNTMSVYGLLCRRREGKVWHRLTLTGSSSD